MKAEVIFDIRPLQKNILHYSPLDRIFAALIKGYVVTFPDRKPPALFADRTRAVPQCLADFCGRTIYAAPFRVEAVVAIELDGSAASLRDLAATQARGLVTTVTVAEASVDPQVGSGSTHDLAVMVRDGDGAVCGEWQISFPIVADAMLAADLDPLDAVQLGALFGGGLPVLAVDGALAVNKDVMRAILGLTRRNPTRVIVCGGATAVEAPQVSVLRPSPAMLAQIVRGSLAVLMPGAGAEMISSAEVAKLGGRGVPVVGDLAIHDLSDLAALPVGDGGQAEPVCHNDFWARVLAAIAQDVVVEVSERPRIALVTPMFPQKGGPPHSSLDLAMALTEFSTLDVWTDGDMLPIHRARVNAVYRLDGRFDAGRYDRVVYVLGNHPMYLRIFDMMREHGGTLILHDAHMIDFLNHRYGRRQLEALLFAEHGEPIDASDPGRIISELARYGRPFLHEIVRHANPTIVHSPTSAALLRSLYGIEAHYFPVAMPYPFDRAELTADARIQAKTMLGISLIRPCIASFGEVHMMKGAKQCLFVMKELVDWGIDFQFLFVGPVEPAFRDELTQRIAQYGLQDNVIIKGSVSESDYIQYLKAVDIVLQIRQIPFGQVSGALLDAVSAGMHGVVSENLARSIEAPPLVRRVHDKASPTVYAEQLAEMIAMKSYEERPGPGWEGFTVRHDFAKYARDLMTLLFGRAH